jgi:hypothetical protein
MAPIPFGLPSWRHLMMSSPVPASSPSRHRFFRVPFTSSRCTSGMSWPARLRGLSLLLALLAWPPGAQALSKPPTSSDVQDILDEGFPTARRRLETSIAQAYVPGKTAPLDSWLHLWRWCDLLSRDSSEDNARLVERHFFRSKSSGHLFFLKPGQIPPSDLQAVSTAEARGMAVAPEIVAQLESAALPPGSTLATGPLSDITGKSLTTELLSDPSFSSAFFSILSQADFAPAVLRNLRAIREAHPRKWREYAHLAIAIAVVNDSAIPEVWPHMQVSPALVPREVPSAPAQFARWVEANETSQLLLDSRKLSPAQLTFVIDAFVTDSELAWARKNTHLNRSNFARAFSQVRYREDRIRAREFHWTTGPYTLKAIRAAGGICVDQAYHAMVAGKAHGLPTLFFTGQGSHGGHAWFGYMKSDDRWELDCGRYSQQNFAIGQAYDPQTWQPISDHELKLLAARFRDKPEFAASQNELAIARILEKSGDPTRAAEALESAIRACPQNPDAWSAQGDFLQRTRAPAAQRLKFHQDAARQLAPHPDLKVHHQQAIAAIHRETGDNTAADKIERLILVQNRRDRSDLSIAVAASKLHTALQSDDISEAAKEFHRQLNSIGKNSGGQFVNEVAIPFLDALLARGDKNRSRRTLSILRQKFSPERGSPLDLLLRDREQAAK